MQKETDMPYILLYLCRGWIFEVVTVKVRAVEGECWRE